MGIANVKYAYWKHLRKKSQISQRHFYMRWIFRWFAKGIYHKTAMAAFFGFTGHMTFTCYITSCKRSQKSHGTFGCEKKLIFRINLQKSTVIIYTNKKLTSQKYMGPGNPSPWLIMRRKKWLASHKVTETREWRYRFFFLRNFKTVMETLRLFQSSSNSTSTSANLLLN